MSSLGFGPLDRLLDDQGVTSVAVLSPERIFVERATGREAAGLSFGSAAELAACLADFTAAHDLELSPASPTIDAILPNGFRLVAVVPPVSDTPVFTVSRLAGAGLTLDDLGEAEAFSAKMADFLRDALAARVSIGIYGEADAGATTLMGALVNELPPSLGLAVVENRRELVVDVDRHPHLVRLMTAPTRSAAELVRMVDRSMGLDVIAVGELDGEVVSEALAASASSAVIFTFHASAPDRALARLAQAALADGSQPDQTAAARRLVAGGVQILVGVTRKVDGSRRINRIDEVLTPDEKGNFRVAPIFRLIESESVDGRSQLSFAHEAAYVMGGVLRRSFDRAGLLPDRWSGSEATASVGRRRSLNR